MKPISGNISDVATDLAFKYPERRVFIVHGCNCFHTMGAGVAKQLNIDFTGVLQADKRTEYGDKTKLGTYSFAKQRENLAIINLYTQFRYGRGMHVDYLAVQRGFKLLATKLRPTDIILYPKIGAGLAGGNWLRISKIIDNELQGYDHRLVILN